MTMIVVVLVWLALALVVALLVGPLLARVSRLREKHEAPADPLRWLYVRPQHRFPAGRRRG